MDKDDIGTFSITFKTTNEGYAYITSWMEEFTDIVSNKVLPKTEGLYEEDELFRKLVKSVKSAQRERDNYINKHNK